MQTTMAGKYRLTRKPCEWADDLAALPQGIGNAERLAVALLPWGCSKIRVEAMRMEGMDKAIKSFLSR